MGSSPIEVKIGELFLLAEFKRSHSAMLMSGTGVGGGALGDYPY